MGIEEIREYCLSLPGTTEGMKWGEHLTFMVGTKMFAVFSLDKTPINASFKVRDEEFEPMCERPEMRPAPYFAKLKWIAVESIDSFGKKEWEETLSTAYTIIRDKLPKKTRESL